MKIFAIGDIHGCFDKLKKLMDNLHNKGLNLKKDKLIFLGDYIDRGNQSKEVIQYLINIKFNYPDNTIFLMGNHEKMFLDYYYIINQNLFIYNGGNQTLKSYGFDLFESLENKFPKTHLKFISSLDLLYEDKNYIFVHAGLKPYIKIKKQDPKDLIWIRNEFINNDYNWGKKIIFGHTPQKDPLIMKNKIGIDTGAVFNGKLTAIKLPDEKFYFSN